MKKHLQWVWSEGGAFSSLRCAVNRYDWEKPCSFGQTIADRQKAFFDSIDHDLMVKALRKHAEEKWVTLYVQRWLQASV